MAQIAPDRRSFCPISFTLDILGDKWTLLVIRDLVFAHKRNFRDFLASDEKIATNILAQRLKALEANGIVSRRTDPENARKIIYALTEKGINLLPVLLELISWGATYDPQTAAPKAFVKRLAKDREGLIDEIGAMLRNEAQR